jgi:hypothetical protein
MNNWKLAFALAIAALGVTVSVVVHAQQSSTGASKSEAKSDSSQVHRIVLPKYPPEIRAGPNVETYNNNCLICHTARYVLMQPRFPKTVWQSEVKKMVDAYGAPISEADQALIVEYLVAVRGVEAPAASAPPK